MARFTAFIFFCIFLTLCTLAHADDWPTFNHDNHRSGVTSERLELPLKKSWVFKATHPPKPAWPVPAKQDFWHYHYNLRPTVTFDRAFQIVGVSDALYFGSSSDDKVYALDATTGRQRWAFFTEGPVRLAPTIVGNRVYVGSDDGCVYCLSANDGSLIWKYMVAEQNRMVPGNGRMISMWPVRTGLVVDAGKVYSAAGLFPDRGVFLSALSAEDGTVKWKQKVTISAQGYMLASDERLYVPTGRTSPAIFTRVDGSSQGQLPSAGGAYALLTEDVLVTGPGRGPKKLSANDVKTKDTIATFGGLRMLVSNGTAYMQSENELTAFARGQYLELSRKNNDLRKQHNELEEQLKKLDKDRLDAKQLQENLRELKMELAGLSERLENCYLWTAQCEYPYSMIMAGDVLFVGGENKVAALSTENGSVIWSAPVSGTAHGLCVINGSLYVSTSNGQIHCFRSNIQGDGKVITAKTDTNPYPPDELTELYAEAAKHIVQQPGISKGYCLVLDSGKGRLAYELAKLTDLKIIGVERDINNVEIARKALDKAGLYGRVAVHQGSSVKLPYTGYFANLIVSDQALRTGKLPASAEEVFRLLRPYGGIVALGQQTAKQDRDNLKRWGQASVPHWKVHKGDKIVWGLGQRGKLKGAGEWTHTYAEPGNTACSKDELIKGSTTIQWFGQPGPRHMIDRHHRNVPPLFKDGRLFVPGDSILFAVDAYNGTIQWQVEIPNSRRVGVPLDCSNMAVDEQFLYVVAEGECYGFDVMSGLRRLTHTMPQLIKGQPRNWGYIAYSGDILFGSACRKGASYSETSRDVADALYGRNEKLVISDYLFAMDKNGGKLLWKYKDGLIVNTTITAGGGRIYFVETHSPKALADNLGRMPAKTLFDGTNQCLVALDMQTGRPVYKKKIDTDNLQELTYLSYAKDVLILSGSREVAKTVHCYFYALDAGTGQIRWQVSHDSGLPSDGGHGEYNRHPTIIDDTVYTWPYAYSLKTGRRQKEWKFDRHGHGCGGVSASAQCLFWRGHNPWMYDLGPEGGPSRLNKVTRPGCWINIIPAGGLVLIPEASSGCTCGYPLQTSIAFVPN